MKIKINTVKKKTVRTIFCLLFTIHYSLITNYSFSQDGVAIKTTGATADASAMLDINSATQGILIPRLTTAQRNAIPLPANGLLIYNTDENKFNYYNSVAGYWYQISGTFISSTTGTISPGGGLSINVNPDTPPHNSAILDIDDPSRGILIPRKAGAITSPIQGLIFYNTSTNSFNYYTGGGWIVPCGSSTGVSGAGGPALSSSGVAINITNSDADGSAVLDVTASNKGLLIPRLTTSQRNDILPVQGLTVYNTSTNTVDYYNGTGWYFLEYNASTEADAIDGSATVCQGQNNVSYSTPAITNATSYSWTYSGAGATITGSSNTVTVNFSVAATSGNLNVNGVNYCGTGSASPNYAVTVDPLPAAGGTISGTTSICQGQNNVAYSTPVIINATIYSWTYSGTGATISGTTNSVSINFSSAATAGSLFVQGVNYCGNGVASSGYGLSINPLPAGAPAISGTTAVCQGLSGIAYSVPVLSDAVTYSWVYSGTGATINGTTNSVTVNFSSTATSGNLTVRGINACGNGTVSPNKAITLNTVPAAAGTISGTSTVCIGQSGVAYSVAAITAASSYSWVYSGTGATIYGATNSVTVDFSASATSGNLTVRGINDCGNGTVSPNKAVTVSSSPSSPTALSPSGESVCEFNARWTSVSGATHYHLDVSTSMSFSSGWIENDLDVGNVTSYNVDGIDPEDTYYYRVRAENGCGTSANSNRNDATTDDDPCVAATFDEDVTGGGSFWTYTYTATSNGYVKLYRYGADCYNPSYIGYIYVTIGESTSRGCTSGCCGSGDEKWMTGCCPAACPCPW